MVTFPVDDVTPAGEALPTRPRGELFPDALVTGGDPGTPLVEPDGVHPLLSAVGRAFAEHRPLVLSPDAVWLTVVQGVAQHIRLHAEELRPRLVAHAGRKRLTVVLAGAMPQDADSWREFVDLFQKLLAAEIDDPELFECDFSTSTQVDRVAGRIVLLDAYSPYFALWMMFVCGIPSITLTGTIEDWQRIRARVERIAGLGLETWCRSLRPILDQFVRAASGNVDTAFWRRIYSPADAYGGDVITGWAARLYPYLRSGAGGTCDEPNPLLDLPVEQPRDVTVNGAPYRGPGISSDRVPATLSRALVGVNDQVSGDNRRLALHGGLVGVAQDDDGALRPVAGWYLASATAELDEVVDRIARDHHTTPPELGNPGNLPAELVELYQRVGSATLFDNSWRLLPVVEHRHVWPKDLPGVLTAVIDLPGGRSVAAFTNYSTGSTHWVVGRVEEDPDAPDPYFRFRLADEPADVPVYGTSLALLLDAALDFGGEFAHLKTGRLDELWVPVPATPVREASDE